MTLRVSGDLHYDPYDADINVDPYPTFRRLREEAPLYYNEQYDFYAISRFADVNGNLPDPETFSSSRSIILELIKSKVPIPPGIILFEDPPIHDVHRSLLARRSSTSATWSVRPLRSGQRGRSPGGGLTTPRRRPL